MGVSLRFVIFSLISLVLVFSSCSKPYKTLDPLTQTERSRINKLAIVTNTEEEFDVKLFQAGELPGFEPYVYVPPGGAALGGGIIALALLVANLGMAYSQYHSDENIEDDLSPLLVNFDPDRALARKMIKHLELTNMFDQLEISDTDNLALLEKNGADAVLEMNIEKWGLFICTDPAFWENWESNCKYESLESLSTAKRVCPPVDQVTVMLITSDRMFLVKDNINVWEQRKHYLDNRCETLDNLRNKEGLLVDFLNNAIDRYSSETANEIRYSESGTD